ncbi:MAG: riboflavin synthase [Rhodospirillales bacterium]|nr:riboflavin synthase [Rhodospirillales bacterium]MBO6786808.1 riboflavin synthase [Rhodospirillales bacterium]
MFTGIITDIGAVKAVTQGSDTRFDIATNYDMATVAIGASIACSGACLTVIEKDDGWFAVEASQETLDKTTAGAWREGTPLNLERALKVGDELGGHIVTGHVDGVGEVRAVSPVGGSLKIDFEAPESVAKFIAEKGSVTVDGVSLTVNGVTGTAFSVNIIPHTQTETTLGKLQAGDRVNLEIDVLARYVARLNDVKG